MPNEEDNSENFAVRVRHSFFTLFVPGWATGHILFRLFFVLHQIALADSRMAKSLPFLAFIYYLL